MAVEGQYLERKRKKKNIPQDYFPNLKNKMIVFHFQ